MKKQGFLGALSGALQKFKKFPILYNFTVIVLLLTLLGLISFFAMWIGTRHSARRSVPSFIGMLMEEAEEVARKNDLIIEVNDSLFIAGQPGGAVLDQLPRGGAVVKPGRKIYVTLNSFRQRMVDVPYVAGRSLRHATNILEAAGLGIERIEYTRDLATNYVLAQYAGEKRVLENSNIKAEKGSGIILHVGVSATARPLIVPPFIGRNFNDARSRLWESGFNLGKVVYDDGIPAIERSRAKVYAQSAKPGTSASYGAVVSLYLTLDEKKVQEALDGHDVKALEAKLAADSLAEVELQRVTDSLATLNALELQGEGPGADVTLDGAPAADSLAITTVESEL